MSSFRLGIKVCVLMIPFLGITWLFGLLSPLHKAFAYIFTILNSTQVCCKFPLALLIKVRDLNTLNKRNNSIYQSINVAIRPSIFSQSFRLPIYQSFLQFFNFLNFFFIILIAILPFSQSIPSQSLNHLFFSLHKLTSYFLLS